MAISFDYFKSLVFPPQNDLKIQGGEDPKRENKITWLNLDLVTLSRVALFCVINVACRNSCYVLFVYSIFI